MKHSYQTAEGNVTVLTVEEHLSPEAAGARLGVDDSTIRRAIKSRKIRRVVKLGRKCVRIPASELNRYLSSHTVK